MAAAAVALHLKDFFFRHIVACVSHFDNGGRIINVNLNQKMGPCAAANRSALKNHAIHLVIREHKVAA